MHATNFADFERVKNLQACHGEEKNMNTCIQENLKNS
jgi:hypothetical protein